MKILMCGLLPFESSINYGGVVAVIRNLLEGFEGIDSLQVCHVSFNKEIRKAEILTPAPNIKIRFIPFRSGFDLLDYWLNKRVLDDIIREENPDLIHIQEITPQLLRFLHIDRSRIVVTQHGIMREEQKYFRDINAQIKGYFKSWMERLLFPVFQNLIFISDYNRKLFRGQPAHAEVIFNPVSSLFFQEQDSAGDPNSLLMVAAFSPIKNLELLLEVLARLKKSGSPCKLHLAGGFKKKWHEDSIHQKIELLNLKEDIIFHGWCTPVQIKELLNQCSIFILPSRQETLPVAIEEAMAVGRVVVASDVGAVSEMFVDGESGLLFPDNDEDGLFCLLQHLLNDPAKRERLARHARTEAKRRFHPATIAQQTFSFYQEVRQAQPEPIQA